MSVTVNQYYLPLFLLAESISLASHDFSLPGIAKICERERSHSLCFVPSDKLEQERERGGKREEEDREKCGGDIASSQES